MRHHCLRPGLGPSLPLSTAACVGEPNPPLMVELTRYAKQTRAGLLCDLSDAWRQHSLPVKIRSRHGALFGIGAAHIWTPNANAQAHLILALPPNLPPTSEYIKLDAHGSSAMLAGVHPPVWVPGCGVAPELGGRSPDNEVVQSLSHHRQRL